MKNIKQLFLSFFTILCVHNVYAQESGFFFGVNGSYNATIVANQQNYGQKEMDYDAVTSHPSYGIQLGYDMGGKNILTIGAGIMNGGQKYKDSYGNGDKLNKEIQLQYLSIPVSFTHVIGKKENIRKGVKLFVTLGPQFDLLQKATVNHTINGVDASLLRFATYPAGGGNFDNFNKVDIEKLVGTDGNPADDKELFQSMDIKAFLGLGLRSNISENFTLDFEVRAGGTITDINAEAWKLDGFKDGSRQDYEASNNVFGGLRLGLNYRF